MIRSHHMTTYYLYHFFNGPLSDTVKLWSTGIQTSIYELVGGAQLRICKWHLSYNLLHSSAIGNRLYLEKSTENSLSKDIVENNGGVGGEQFRWGLYFHNTSQMTENQKSSPEITVNSGSREGCNQGFTNSGVIRKGHETDFKAFPKLHTDPST